MPARKTLLPMLLAAALGASAAPALAADGQCAATSGEHTTALLELYTSEGCNSCPPADKWVRELRQKGLTADQVVPLAFHVDYWDYIGWKDRFARPDYTERQRTMVHFNRSNTIYTPQLLLNGKDARQAVRGDFAGKLKDLNAAKARAHIALALSPAAGGGLDLLGRLRVADGTAPDEAIAFIAVYENNLASNVKAGENSGARLEHDYVVRQLVGPIKFDAAGSTLEIRRTLALDPQWKTKDTGVVAFVQSARTGEVMQALQLPLCAASS